jgi:hypothetical protein
MPCPNQELNTRLDSSGAPFRSKDEYCSPANTLVGHIAGQRAHKCVAIQDACPVCRPEGDSERRRRGDAGPEVRVQMMVI